MTLHWTAGPTEPRLKIKKKQEPRFIADRDKKTRIDDAEIERRVTEVNTTWQKATQSIIEVGRLLIKTKAEIAHGKWRTLFRDYDDDDRAPVTFPFGQRTAEMLMEIADHSILSNPKFVSNLPPSWGTLYEMTRMPEEELETLIENGTINADIRRSDVEAIVDGVRVDGLYIFKHVADCLSRLVPFMKKWPDHHHRIVEVCVEERDDCSTRPNWPSCRRGSKTSPAMRGGGEILELNIRHSLVVRRRCTGLTENPARLAAGKGTTQGVPSSLSHAPTAPSVVLCILEFRSKPLWVFVRRPCEGCREQTYLTFSVEVCAARSLTRLFASGRHPWPLRLGMATEPLQEDLSRANEHWI